MKEEIQVAIDLILKMLPDWNGSEIERSRLSGALEKALMTRCMQTCWNNVDIERGSSSRCVTVFSEQIDPLLVDAIKTAGLSSSLILKFHPIESVIWIDPGMVSYRFGGDRSPIKIAYPSTRVNKVEFDSPHSVKMTTSLVEDLSKIKKKSQST